ncbi:Hypothetical_protein [Hexamita inflata]|uniref:Hypothetical_protein n=1 Tax=Hexamita inflata TaxID=28002 RepID=A0AA86NXD7_9EUKA|nr:Hypothetical protein HINF_LOCUS14088 [Hexamita inflata]CAI9926449.1 Hypothetical protein HINF_LOCUS14094 [Hexamita inflata]
MILNTDQTISKSARNRNQLQSAKMNLQQLNLQNISLFLLYRRFQVIKSYNRVLISRLSQRNQYAQMIVNQLQISEKVKIEQNSVNSDLIQFSPKHRGFSAKYLNWQYVMFIAAIFYNKMRYECLKVQIVKRVRLSVWHTLSTLDESSKVHKCILLRRPLKKLNIWKSGDLSSQFINKIMSLENNQSLFLEADQNKPSGDDVILHHYTKAQRHLRFLILPQAAKQYFNKCPEQFYCQE